MLRLDYDRLLAMNLSVRELRSLYSLLGIQFLYVKLRNCQGALVDLVHTDLTLLNIVITNIYSAIKLVLMRNCGYPSVICYLLGPLALFPINVLVWHIFHRLRLHMIVISLRRHRL